LKVSRGWRISFNLIFFVLGPDFLWNLKAPQMEGTTAIRDREERDWSDVDEINAMID
jgi:hypothetical protein